MMEEKVCVKWNDFQKNIKSSFASIRKDFEFADVTLACEDGQQLEAHRVILAASSPFFQKLFRRNKHTHPLLYMRDVVFQDLVAIVDFLYCGEANILQENLDSFLTLAEDLKLEGIIGQTDSRSREESPSADNEPCSISDQTNAESNTLQSPMKKETSNNYLTETWLVTNSEDTQVRNDAQIHFLPQYLLESPIKTHSVQASHVGQDLEELGKKVKSMMSRSENRMCNGKQRAAICNVCGKEGASTGIRDHIEANHLEGVSLPCKFCARKSSSRHALTMHMLRKHKT